MIIDAQAVLTAQLVGARAVGEKLLKDLSCIVPFGLTLDAAQKISEVVFPGGDTAVQALSGGTDVLLSRETLLNLEMRRRAQNADVVSMALATSRETTESAVLCVQCELLSEVASFAYPYRKKFFGWSFGEPGRLDAVPFVLPQDGEPSSPPDEGPFQNAFAPAVGGDALYHRKSGFRFPAQVCGFTMCNPRQYDAHGHDVSHGYQHGSMEELAVTAYVYPSAGDTSDVALAAHFEKCRKDIESAHAMAKPVFEDVARLAIGNTPRVGRQGVYRLRTEVNKTAMDSLSEIWLFAHGRFFIKYRASYPPGLKKDAPNAVRHLVAALAWPGAA